MKLTVDRDDLVSAVSAAVRGTAKQGAAMHVLSDVVLRAEGGQLHAMGTDLDIEISASVPAEVEAEGAIALPGRVFLELTRRLSGGSVRLEAIDGPGVCIEQGRSSFKLQGLDPERHPGGLAKAPEDSAVSIDGGLLAEVAAKTWPYVATDITRPVLTGVCIEADGENLQAVATDGFRMGIVARGGLKGVRIRRCVVPARALAEAARIVQPGEDVRVCVGESVISFETPAGRVAGRLIQGQYPDVLASIPANYPMRAVASRAELTEAVRRAALVAAMSPASWGSSRHTVTLDIRRGCIVVGAEAPDAGEAREEIAAETSLGLHIRIGFDARYLLQGLKAVDADDVEICLAGPLQPARLRGAGDESFTYILAPVKIHDAVAEAEAEPEAGEAEAEEPAEPSEAEEEVPF